MGWGVGEEVVTTTNGCGSRNIPDVATGGRYLIHLPPTPKATRSLQESGPFVSDTEALLVVMNFCLGWGDFWVEGQSLDCSRTIATDKF